MKIIKKASLIVLLSCILPSLAMATIDIRDYGAIPNDDLDDSAAIQAAINAANSANGQEVFFPAGSYNIETTVTYKSNAKLVGEARRGVSYYDAPAPVDTPVGTVIIVKSGITGFAPLNVPCIQPEIRNLTFMVDGYDHEDSSPFGGEANSAAEGTIAIDIFRTRDMRIEGVDFYNFHIAINGISSARLLLEDFTAYDCKFVVKLESGADATISHGSSIIHCDNHIYLYSVDGVTISNNYFFQAYTSQIYMEECQFMTLTGNKIFETNEGPNVKVVNGSYLTSSANFLARSGWYNPGGLLSADTVPGYDISGTENIFIQDHFIQPRGRAIHIKNSNAININAGMKFVYTAIGGDSAIKLESCTDAFISGQLEGTNSTYSIFADDNCSNISGFINAKVPARGTTTSGNISLNKTITLVGSGTTQTLVTLDMVGSPLTYTALIEVLVHVQPVGPNGGATSYAAYTRKYLVRMVKSTIHNGVSAIVTQADYSISTSNSNYSMSIVPSATAVSPYQATFSITPTSTGSTPWSNCDIAVVAKVTTLGQTAMLK